MAAQTAPGGDATEDSAEASEPPSVVDSLSQPSLTTTSSHSSSELSYTHPSVLDSGHIDSLQVFIDDVNKSLSGALGRGGSIYRKATILFLRWEDDIFIKPGINNGVQGEIDRLESVLVVEYGFGSEMYLIPNHCSQLSLMRRIMDFQAAHDSVDELLLVYYGGHGTPNKYDQSIWAQGKGPIVEWFSIQPILEHAAPDVLLILDCCFAASAGLTSVNGAVEILAACGRELGTIGVSNWSFTSRLTELLYEKRHQKFTVAQLHSDLMNFRAVSGAKKLLRTPVHAIMSHRDKASLQICPLRKDSADLEQGDSDLVELKRDSSERQSASRVLVSVTMEGPVDSGAWRDWLTSQLPSGISGLSLVRPEGIWGSHSSLILFSLPVPLWDLLADRSAYSFVGFVTTRNLVHDSAYECRSATKPVDNQNIGDLSASAEKVSAYSPVELAIGNYRNFSKPTELLPGSQKPLYKPMHMPKGRKPPGPGWVSYGNPPTVWVPANPFATRARMTDVAKSPAAQVSSVKERPTAQAISVTKPPRERVHRVIMEKLGDIWGLLNSDLLILEAILAECDYSTLKLELSIERKKLEHVVKLAFKTDSFLDLATQSIADLEMKIVPLQTLKGLLRNTLDLLQLESRGYRPLAAASLGLNRLEASGADSILGRFLDTLSYLTRLLKLMSPSGKMPSEEDKRDIVLSKQIQSADIFSRAASPLALS